MYFDDGIERGCSGPCEEVLRRMIKMWPLVPGYIQRDGSKLLQMLPAEVDVFFDFEEFPVNSAIGRSVSKDKWCMSSTIFLFPRLVK